MSTNEHKTSNATIAFFWALALAPLSWGVYQTLIKVAAMF
jgi:uncharacterized protein with PQ loop repeat